jgi:hypothetical protein
MKLTIFEAKTQIGEANIFALDPPMGCATAKFAPASDYNAERHADLLDGEQVTEPSPTLRIEMEDGVELKSKAISIHDYPTLDEIELNILGIFEPSFDELFSEHPHYRSYWGQD